MNYFKFVAREVREILAALGARSLEEVIGKTEYLAPLEGISARQNKLDLAPILAKSEAGSHTRLFCSETTNKPLDNGDLNLQIVADAEQAVLSKAGQTLHYNIRNTDRSVGATLSGIIAQHYGNQGMTDYPVTINLMGTAGQSFGVWNAGGLHMNLIGDANDYVGKGMTGGKLVIYPPRNAEYVSHTSAIMGNTCLYGATGGKLFAAGMTGERFAVRNSGAVAVVEGTGDNACEYMTGGIVVVLGQVGVNLGAGMTGGFAYVLDEAGDLEHRINPELVEPLGIQDKNILVEHLRGLINQHYAETGSNRALDMLTNFNDYITKFRLIKPKTSDVKSLLGHISRSSAELRVQAQ